MIQGCGFIVNDDDDYFVKGVEFYDVNNIVDMLKILLMYMK